MCQGIILSVVEFDGKRVVLTGVGSHSRMLKRNKKLLEKKGCTVKSANQNVFSVESDFSKGFGVWQEAGGMSSPELVKLVNRKWKKIAGSAEAVIKHITKVGEIDGALVELLTPKARKVYDETWDAAWEVYNEARDAARKVYSEARDAAWKVYDETWDAAWEVYYETWDAAWEVYNEARDAARKVYSEACVPAFCNLFAKKENRVKVLR